MQRKRAEVALLAPRFSFFQGVATPHESYSEKGKVNWQFAFFSL